MLSRILAGWYRYPSGRRRHIRLRYRDALPITSVTKLDKVALRAEIARILEAERSSA
jgi:uncharacterized small protein (DUF1192 family)